MPDVAYLNQTAVSWGHLKWIVTLPDFGNYGGRFYGFHSLDIGGQKRERQHIQGQNRAQAPMALTEGEYTPPNPKIGWWAHAHQADETAPFESYIAMLAKHAPMGPSGFRSYGDVRMNWTLLIDDGPIKALHQWYDVYIVGDGGSWEKGPDGLKAESEHICKRYALNGNTLYNSSEE